MIAKQFKFNFRSRVVRDENGAEIGRANKNPAIVCDLPILTAEEIISLLQNTESKEAQLIVEAVAGIIFAEAKTQLDDVIEGFGDSNEIATANHLDFSKLDFSYIANMPPATRTRGPQLSDDDWESFYEDYKAVIIPATGKPEAKINNHVNVFKKPAQFKARKDILQALVEHLDLYCTKTPNLESTGPCVEKLQSKFGKWLAVEDTNVADAF